MSTPAVAQAGPSSRDAESVMTRNDTPPLFAALTSAVGLWCAFPPANWGWLAWVALAPLLLLIQSPRSRLSIYLSAWAGGFLFWLLSIYWVSLTDSEAWLAWVVMALALSAWWPGFLALARFAVLRQKWPLMLAAPLLWVGLEFVRAHILTGFAWYYVGHTQHQSLPVIQIADITGALGVSFLVMVVNAWVADLRSIPLFEPTVDGQKIRRSHLIRAGVVLTLVISTLGYGLFRTTTARFHDGPRLALMQSNIRQDRKMHDSEAHIYAIYRTLINRCLEASPLPDLIVWPETSYPYHYIFREPALSAAEYANQAKRLAPNIPDPAAFWTDHEKRAADLLHNLVDQVRIPMLVGVLVYDFHSRGLSKFNSALLLQPTMRTVQRYAKMHLVPFGEYVPLIDIFPWIKVLTPYQGSTVPSLTFGWEPTSFTLGPYRYATAICFEDTVPQAVRPFFSAPDGGRQPDVLLNISNDGWFQGSAEHDTHLAIAVFRAVEHRVPLARAVNMGISAVIDGNGKVLASIPKSKEDVLTVVVPLDDRQGLYSTLGDWLGILCLTFTTGLFLAALWRSVVSRKSAGTPPATALGSTVS